MVTKQRQTTASTAQVTTASRRTWPGKRTAVTPSRTATVGVPGKRSRVQSVRRPKPKPAGG